MISNAAHAPAAVRTGFVPVPRRGLRPRGGSRTMKNPKTRTGRRGAAAGHTREP